MELYQHQIEALKQTEGQNRVAYYLDMGLGKTFVGSEKMMSLGKTTNIVICQKSKVNDWVEHFKEHYDVVVLDITNKKSFRCFVEWSTKWNEHEKPLVGIINYELAWRRPELHNLKDFTLMLDESSLIQNRKAKQTKFIMKFKPDNVILLSGTPCSGKYENLWTQIRLLGWDISEELYNKQYINRRLVDYGGVKFYQVDKKKPYKNVDRLKYKLRQHGSVFMKTDEVFDLPEQNFTNVKVDVSKEYKHFIKNSIVQVDGVELVGDTSLTKLLYARQLCSIYSESKLQAFKDIVESTNDRLIVFYNFNDELVGLMNLVEALRPMSVINGQVKDLSAYNAYDDSVTFVQYQAGAMGLNLQKANKIIYYSPTLRCEHWMQSLKRIHRIGQNKPCFYYKLICKGTVEGQIYKSLEKGVDYTDELFKHDIDSV